MHHLSPMFRRKAPVKELKGFNKVYLAVGESARVHFKLDERSFAIWQKKWVVVEGDYLIMVGGSPNSLPSKKIIHITGESLVYDQLNVAHQAPLSMEFPRLEWVAMPFSRGSSQPRDQTQVSRIAGRCFTI